MVRMGTMGGLTLAVSLVITACNSGSDGSDGTGGAAGSPSQGTGGAAGSPSQGTGGAAGSASTYDEFCDHYCTQGLADGAAAACPNEELISYSDCYEQCTMQLEFIPCPETLQAFWQCTLDEYPGNYTCDENGELVQPESCSAEQQAVSDCT